MLILKSSINRRSVDSAPCGSYLRAQALLYLHCASGFGTQILAYMLDSLVRVSRRVDENHFVSFANPATSLPTSIPSCRTSRTLFSYALDPAGNRGSKSGLSYLCQAQSRVKGFERKRKTHPKLSPASLTEADQPALQDLQTFEYQPNTRNGTRRLGSK